MQALSKSLSSITKVRTPITFSKRNYANVSASEYAFRPETRLLPNLSEMAKQITAQRILDEKDAKVAFIDENEMVYEAIKAMAARNMGSILISRQPEGGERQLAGILTERDYLRKVILKDLTSKTTPISHIMTPNVITAEPSMNLIALAVTMTEGKFRHVPVLPAGRNLPVGIVSSRDVMYRMYDIYKEAGSRCLSASLNEVFNKICRKASKEPYIHSHATVFDALRLMEKHQIGALFVYYGTDVVGIFTERDYLLRVYIQGKRSKETKVRQVMTPLVVTVPPSATVENAVETMKNRGIRNLPVVPLIGQSIDYMDGSDYETLGMLVELNIIKYLLLHYNFTG